MQTKEIFLQEKIEFFRRNEDHNYIFEINNRLPIEKQNVSEKANAILVILYRDYFADEQQKKSFETNIGIRRSKKC